MVTAGLGGTGLAGPRPRQNPRFRWLCSRHLGRVSGSFGARAGHPFTCPAAACGMETDWDEREPLVGEEVISTSCVRRRRPCRMGLGNGDGRLMMGYQCGSSLESRHIGSGDTSSP